MNKDFDFNNVLSFEVETVEEYNASIASSAVNSSLNSTSNSTLASKAGFMKKMKKCIF